MFVGGDVLREFRRDIVQQNGLAMVDTPDGKLIFVVGAARIRRVALAVFDGQAVFDELLLGPVEADAEDACIHDLVHALVELEQDGIEVERGGDLFADFAEQLDRVLLRGNLVGLGANLLRALVDRGFKSFGLGFERFRLAPSLFPLMAADQLPRGQGQQQEEQAVENIGEGGAVPGRKDGEGVTRFFAGTAIVGARADAEPVAARAQAAVVASFACPRLTNPCPRLPADIGSPCRPGLRSSKQQTGSAARCCPAEGAVRGLLRGWCRRRQPATRH